MSLFLIPIIVLALTLVGVSVGVDSEKSNARVEVIDE